MNEGTYFQLINQKTGGEGGIRTHGTVSRSQHFQCCQFNHSCTSPQIADCKFRISDSRGMGEFSRELFKSSISLQIPQFEIRNPKSFWRRGWDLNPRWSFPHSGFRDRCTKPLCDLSAESEPLALTGGFRRPTRHPLTHVVLTILL